MPRDQPTGATVATPQIVAERIRTKLSRNRYPFSYRTISRGIDDRPGLYSFWLGKGCLYVGMSETDVRRRLLEHYRAESNPRLARYFRLFPREILCSHALLGDATLVSEVEPILVGSMNPKTNTHYKRR